MNNETREMLALRDCLSETQQKTKLTTVQSIALLSLVAERGCTCTRLSEVCHISVAATTGMLDRLERLGLSTRRNNAAADRRVVIAVATQGGVETANLILQVWRKDIALTS